MFGKVNTMLLFSSSYIFGVISFMCEKEILCASLLCALLIFAILKDKLKVAFAVFLYFTFMLGVYNCEFRIKDSDALSRIGFNNNVVLEGRVVTIPKSSLNNTRLRFSFDVDRVDVNSRVYEKTDSKTLVTLNEPNGSLADVKIGDYLRIKGKLRKPQGATNPSQFDYAKYLKHQNTFTTFYADGALEVLSAPKFSKEPWWATLYTLDIKRDEVIAKHAKYIKSPRLEVLGGIVFGDDAVNPPDDVRQSFIGSGLLHLLAASGLNVGLIFGIWWFIATKIGIGYRPSIILGMFFVTLYTFMTGFPPSILRASIMILIVLLGKLWHKEANSLSLVFFVAFLMLLFEPQMVNNVGFQLSFLVTIGLLTCTEPIGEKFEELDKAFKATHEVRHLFLRKILNYFSPKYLAMAFFVPIIAQVWVAPLQMYYFHTFTPYSVFANITVLPFIGIMSFLGFISSILAPLPFDFIIQTTDFFINPLAAALLSVSSFFAGFPNALLSVSSPNLFSMLLYYFLVLFFIQLLSENFKNKKQVKLFLILLVVLALSCVRFQARGLEVLAYDVGNADSFLIKTPKGRYIIIDTAKLPYRGSSQASYIMLQHLKDKGIRTLDLLVITHFDNDHSGGVVDILKSVKVKKVLMLKEDHSKANSSSIIQTLKEGKVSYEIAQNATLVYKERDLTVEAYVADLQTKKGDDNENSIITLVTSADKKILFMGDAGYAAFEAVKEDLPQNIDVIKVGHHGAKSTLSKNMLEYLNPKIAIISTGYNTYGHPSYETIKLLEDRGVDILNTNHLGAIKLAAKSGVLKDVSEGGLKAYHYNKGRFLELVPNLQISE